MKIAIPLDKLPNVDKSVVFDYLYKLSFVETIISYIINSKFRYGVNLRTWCLQQTNNERLMVIVEAQGWKNIVNEDLRVKTILRFWQDGGKGGLKYVGDKTTYGEAEYWATIDEILTKLRDDCDGFANIIYHSCKLSGIADNRLFIVAGDVDGGGHCYVVYVGNNALEYPIDGCYWTDLSLMMKIPYVQRNEYFNGLKEWFRFNSTGTYKTREE